MESENTKILWDVPFQLQKAPENGANKIDMAVYNKRTNNWTQIEGTVCPVGAIAFKTAKKQEKYTELRAGIKRQLYKNTSVKQINVVFEFLNKSMLFSNFVGGYREKLRKGLSSITNTDKDLSFLIERCQKRIICQNANIVKKFYDTYKLFECNEND